MEKQRIVHIFGCDFGEEVFYQSQIWETKPSQPNHLQSYWSQESEADLESGKI